MKLTAALVTFFAAHAAYAGPATTSKLIRESVTAGPAPIAQAAVSSVSNAPDVGTMTTTVGPAETSLAAIDRSLAFLYAELETLRQQQQLSTAEILAIATGAGVGFVVGSIVSGGLLAPMAASAAASMGAGSTTAGAAGATMSTLGTVGSTFAGGSVGDALVD